MLKHGWVILMLAMWGGGADAQGCRTKLPRLDRGGKVAWRIDIAKAFEAARKTQRPIILYYTADW